MEEQCSIRENKMSTVALRSRSKGAGEKEGLSPMHTRLTDMFGIEHPIADGPAEGQLNPQARPYNNCRFFDAFDEPIIGYMDAAQTQAAKLIVRGGFLGVDIFTVNKQRGVANFVGPLNIINDNNVILGYNQQYDTIILSVAQPGWFAWVPNVLIQTPNPAPYVPSLSQQNDD